VSDQIDLSEFVGGFVVEAAELIATANAALLEIETANASETRHPRAVRELFRALHTIKGLAGMIGVDPIVELAHELETVVRNADRSGGRLPRNSVDVALQAMHVIGEQVRAVADRRAVPAVPERLLVAIAGVDAAPVANEPPKITSEWDTKLSASEREQVATAIARGGHAWTLAFAPDHAKAARGITIGTVRGRLAELGDVVKVAPRTTELGIAFDILVVSEAMPDALAAAVMTTADRVVAIASEPFAEPTPDAAEAEPGRASESMPLGRSVVRVELARLDDLQEQLSLLIVSRFRLDREIARHAERGHDVRGLRDVAAVQGRQLRDLRRAILRARTVRVAEALEPLSLLVRSAARASQKQARLEIDARETEIDKGVADRLLPALVHLVRNAVDHAIEPAEDRVTRAKPTVGTIRITCTEIAGNLLELEVSDDGRGIDRAAIAKRANQTIADDAALLAVLASPGFSTRDVATRTSGRGLGMDIVRRIVDNELGGELSVETVEGNGTTFRLRVPVTIAIVDVFTFLCGGQAFVVPVSAVEEIFELSREREVVPPFPERRAGERRVAADRRAGERGTAERRMTERRGSDAPAVSLLEHRGRALPLVALGAVLDLDGGAGAKSALVIRRAGEPIAFAIDKMVGRQEVVVRPISDPLVRVPGIAGATDLGDGRPTLVLDLVELGLGIAAIASPGGAR